MGRRRQRVNDDGDLHAGVAEPGAANEVVALGLVKEYEILAAAPVAGRPFCRTVVVPSLIHLKHIVCVLLVTKCFSVKRAQRSESARQIAGSRRKEDEDNGGERLQMKSLT